MVNESVESSPPAARRVPFGAPPTGVVFHRSRRLAGADSLDFNRPAENPIAGPQTSNDAWAKLLKFEKDIIRKQPGSGAWKILKQKCEEKACILGLPHYIIPAYRGRPARQPIWPRRTSS